MDSIRSSKQQKGLIISAILTVMGANIVFADGWDPNSKASNTDSIVNTRHNMTMSYLGGASVNMDSARNDYAEVCVYCHTPHGANSTIGAPLWNRTNPGTSYTVYNKPLTSGQTARAPGVNSLVCLSCHDGTVAIDSVINMPNRPGLKSYDASQQTAQNDAFLSTWPDNSPIMHAKLSDCLLCHTSTNPFAPDFSAFLIGTDLRDDHPIGVSLPDTKIYDFNPTTGTSGNLSFYDTNTNGRADSNELRFYNSGQGFEVECASCHNPHGTPISSATTNGTHGGPLIPSFLRVNDQSTLCLTCHNK